MHAVPTGVLVAFLMVAAVLDGWIWIVAFAVIYVWLGYRYAKPMKAQAVEWTWRDWIGCIVLWPALKFIDWMDRPPRP